MNNRELKIKLISDELVKFEMQIRNLNSQNLYDINIVSENLICTLLNLVFDYKLVNINKSSTNYPSVDLVDDSNRIAVQVSSDKSKTKIQKTLNVFSDNALYDKYDKLIFFVLGEKQKRYSNLNIPQNVSFNMEDDIFDFKYLLKQIGNLSIGKIEQIYQHLVSELSGKKDTKAKPTSRTKFKQIQSIKKLIEKELLRKMSQQDWIEHEELLYYVPSHKFKYDQLVIRSVDDRSFPDYTYNEQGVPNWSKLSIWDFYEFGLEFVDSRFSKQVVILEDESWYLTEDREPNAQNVWVFLKIPYENMVGLDIDGDGFTGYPSLFVEYSNNDVPYENPILGLIGYYNHPNVLPKSRKIYYLDPAKEIKK